MSRHARTLLSLAFAVLVLAPPVRADEISDINQLLKSGQHAQALARVDKYLAGRPKDAQARFLKGLILAEQGKPSDAIDVFTKLSQDYPELPEPYNNVAVLYASQGQYDKARDALELAIRTHPSYATAHENLGDIYAKMASQAYDKALQLDKSNTTAQSKLNMIRDLFPADPRAAKATAAASKPDPAAKVVAAAPQASPQAAYDPTKAAPTPSAAPAAAPAAKPAPAKAGAPSAEEVLASVNAWAQAWSNNDIPGYLGAYAADFRPAGGASRAAWEAERKQRIAKPRQIQVAIEAPRVEFDDNGRATVTFRQQYRSDALKSTNNKTLVMTKAGDRWLIQQERSGG